MLVVAVSSVTLALVLYTLGIWLPRKEKPLSTVPVVLVWAGFGFDTLGTVLMSALAGGWKPTFHGLTGLTANGLMLVVAVWATVVGRTAPTDPGAGKAYRWGSRILWFGWLVPMVTGMVFGGRV